jgi:hypothetical protein
MQVRKSARYLLKRGYINLLHFKKDKNKEVKDLILKKYFNSRSEKKAIVHAANESAKEQNELLARYRQLIRP